MVQQVWDALPKHYHNIQLDEFVIMPNHVHGIITIIKPCNHNVGAGFPRPQSMGAETAPLRKITLGQMIGFFKYQSTKQINILQQTPGISVWQRNYYEHIIRNETDLNKIREYIFHNPLQWDWDQENPNRLT